MAESTQRDACEQREQQQRESALGARIGDDLLHRLHAEDRLLRIGLADRLASPPCPSASGGPVVRTTKLICWLGKSCAERNTLLAGRLIGRHLANVPGDPHDRHPRSLGAEDLNPPADRVFVRPVLLRHRPVDHASLGPLESVTAASVRPRSTGISIV